jgi:hypothetical protein
MSPEIPIKSIGAELVQAADEWERSPGEILTELFPYVFEASKRMSTREISRWLEESHGIKMSQPTVSRALRNPDKYWQTFAESMEPHARIVERAGKLSISQFMQDGSLFQWATQEENLEFAGSNAEEAFADRNEVGAAINFLRDHWFCLSDTTRANMHHYFDDDEEDGPDAENQMEDAK